MVGKEALPGWRIFRFARRPEMLSNNIPDDGHCFSPLSLPIETS